jgi:glycosyltransferase involved in cell wall biosynthesis
MKASLILTIKNENKTVDLFLNSICKQSLLPDEIIITDANSTDGTFEQLSIWEKRLPNLKVIKISNENRSRGRNIAIRESKNEIIAISDFGCKPGHMWFEEITKPFQHSNIDIVSGYYINDKTDIRSLAISYFTHPSLDEISPETFLPSARSMAIKKTVWDAIQGFPEHLDFAEDTYFDIRLQRAGRIFFFNPKAIVEWSAGNNIFEVFAKIFRYSRWDAIASLNKNIYFKKIVLYLFFTFIIIIAFLNILLVPIPILFFSAYGLKTFIAALKKIKKMAPSLLACLLKPVFDTSQIIGFLFGSITKLFFKKNLQ